MPKKRKSPSKVGRKRSSESSAHKARSKPATRAARKPRPAPDPLDLLVEAATRALALPIEPEWRPAIKANLAINLEMGALVAAFALPDEAEPAPIFRA